MTDLAARPRGGWQVGARGVRELRGPWGPDHPDPSPDCYSVTWYGDRSRAVIRHYRTPDDLAACCITEVTRQPGESDIEALQRAYPPFALCARSAVTK